MAQAMCFLPLSLVVQQSTTTPTNKISTRHMQKTTLTSPTPSSGYDAGETNTAFDMLVKRALLCQARKEGSSPQDIYHYLRKRCDASENTIQNKINSSLCRLLKHGFVCLHNKHMRRFKLTAKGKCMRYVEKKKSICRYPNRSRSRSLARSSCIKKNVCKYPTERHGRSRSRRRVASRSRSRAETKLRSKSRCRSKSRKPKNACGYPIRSKVQPKKKRC